MPSFYGILLLVLCAPLTNAKPIITGYTNTSASSTPEVYKSSTTTCLLTASDAAQSSSSSSLSTPAAYEASSSTSDTSNAHPTPSAFGEGVLAQSGGMDWSYLTEAHTTLSTATQSLQRFTYSPSTATPAPHYSYASSQPSYPAQPAYTNNTISPSRSSSTTILYLTKTVYPIPAGTGTLQSDATSSASQVAQPYSQAIDGTRSSSTTIVTLLITLYPTASGTGSGGPAYESVQPTSTPFNPPGYSSDGAKEPSSYASKSSILSQPTSPISISPEATLSTSLDSSVATSSTGHATGSSPSPSSSSFAYPIPTYSSATEASYNTGTPSASTSSSAPQLPSIVTAYPESSQTAPTYSFSSSSSSSSTSSTSTAMAGITIVPVTTYSNAITVTITVTDYGATTTVTAAAATVTVTAGPGGY